MSNKPKMISKNGHFILIDSTDEKLKTKRIQRFLDRYHAYFKNPLTFELSPDLNYVQLTEFIQKLNNKLGSRIELDSSVVEFIRANRYAIEEQRTAGLTIKEHDNRWKQELIKFQKTLDQEISRPLKAQQIKASFYLTVMKRAANFSVPGAGKTAMMYGTYAYLTSDAINKVDKILVISPINAFEAWKSEYAEVFGKKRILNFMNLKKYKDAGSIRSGWGRANVIVINYESLSSWKLTVLNELIDAKTMLVFDEVHRVKNPNGKRAKNVLTLGQSAKYRYVLTGTPIPNSYKDIYNFLHILYDKEYDSYFGWSIPELEQSAASKVNEKLQPFFWRTNKQDLCVPPADNDQIIRVNPSMEQKELANIINNTETNVLAKYIRLLQASTNPALLTEKIDLNNLGFLDGELNYSIDSSLNDAEKSDAKKRIYLDLNVDQIRTPKFDGGIKLINNLVSEGKKVLVWGMFIGTMQKIYQELINSGIKTNLIYGQTPKDDRVNLINQFRNENVQVLISNPATLGESISLHQTVHDAIYFEYNFNLTFMLQSRDRIHRLGLPSEQYTRYYYLITEGDKAHNGFIDWRVYNRLKEKEQIMLNAIDGDLLLPEIPTSYLDDVKNIILD